MNLMDTLVLKAMKAAYLHGWSDGVADERDQETIGFEKWCNTNYGTDLPEDDENPDLVLGVYRDVKTSPAEQVNVPWPWKLFGCTPDELRELPAEFKKTYARILRERMDTKFVEAGVAEAIETAIAILEGRG